MQWKYRNNRKSVPQLGINETCSFTGTVLYQMRRKKIMNMSCRFPLQSFQQYKGSINMTTFLLCSSTFWLQFQTEIVFCLAFSSKLVFQDDVLHSFCLLLQRAALQQLLKSFLQSLEITLKEKGL